MSPSVVQPLALRPAAVFSGSLWYSKALPSEKYTPPFSPGGSSSPSSSQMCSTPTTARPTVPLCASHSVEFTSVMPMPSVPA